MALHPPPSRFRPRLVILVNHREDGWRFYSTPLPRNALVVASDFHTKFSKDISNYDCSYASGLIFFEEMRLRREAEDEERGICKPLTGQCVILPEIRGYSFNYLGFDPVDYEFKVLFMNTRDHIVYKDTDCHILTLGTGNLRWRKIQCPFTHEPEWHKICIDGVLYYLAQRRRLDGRTFDLIVCFDVRSEKFKFIDRSKKFKFIDGLINYKGKLCAIALEYDAFGGFLLKLSMWVLEDVKKQKWSKDVYSFCAENQIGKVNCNLSVSGMTATGDIVFTMRYKTSKPFYVFYLNRGRNTLQPVEIQGVGANLDCREY